MGFFESVKKYYNYMVYSARATLKADVAGSYLNWIWWVLEPLGMMVIYAVIFSWLFKGSIEYFPVFIFVGNTVWGFFSRVVSMSTNLIKNYEILISRVYIPKHILLITQMFVEGFRMLICFGLTAVLLLVFRVPLTFKIIWIIPIVIVLFVVTFGFASILLDLGVYISDLPHAMSIILTVWMYFSAIFYDMSMIPEPFSSILIRFNPAALIIMSARRALMYGETPPVRWLIAWFITGVLFSIWGISIIRKHENNYMKIS